MKTKIGAIVVGLILIGGWFIYNNVVQKETTGVKFRLIDGETNEPIANWKIIICDGMWEDTPCEESSPSFVQATKSNSSGIFFFDVNKIPKKSIVINLGEPYYYRKIGRGDNLGHNFNPYFIRVVETEKNWKVRVNKLYDLRNKQVKIIPLKGEVTTDTFNTVNLIFYKQERPMRMGLGM